MQVMISSSDLFFGLFSVVGKGRPNNQLRFLRPIYTRNENSTIILYYPTGTK